MRKKKSLRIILAVIIMYFGVVYSFALDINVILSELKRLNIKIMGPAKQIETQLPSELSDANWGLKKIICEQGGYNLSAYAGKKVSLTCFPISERYHFIEPLNVWVVSSGDKIVCVYKTVRENSNIIPGVFPVQDSKVKFSQKKITEEVTPVTSYLVCGCGCCGGEEPIKKCLYHSKGDDLNKIVQEDKEMNQSPDCKYMGCSKGIQYNYCD
jgi:hypothetical protein